MWVLDTGITCNRIINLAIYLDHIFSLHKLRYFPQKIFIFTNTGVHSMIRSSKMNAQSTTVFLTPQPYGSPTDLILAVVYIVLMTTGVPSNIMSVIYFATQKVRPGSRKEFFKWVYLNITLNDLFATVFCFPLVSVFLSKRRNSVFFGDEAFCTFWGFLWELVPYYSVFLVLVLSISRMLVLVKPLIVLNTRALIISLGVYIILLIAAKVAFYTAKITQIDFTKRDTLCILIYVENNENIYPVYTFFNIFLLAVPIIPICISCILSIARMSKVKRALQNSKRVIKSKERAEVRKRNRRATVTVIIMTVTYIICNVPVFMNYVLYGVWSAYSWSSNAPEYEELYNNTFMYYYSWNVCLVLLVLINAVLNPVIYFSRMREFKQFVRFHVGSLLKCKCSNEVAPVESDPISMMSM